MSTFYRDDGSRIFITKGARTAHTVCKIEAPQRDRRAETV